MNFVKRVKTLALIIYCHWAGLIFLTAILFVSTITAADATSSQARLIEFEGRVEFSRRGSDAWDPAYTNQVFAAGDQLRTGPRSRAVIEMADRTLARMGESSLMALPEPEDRNGYWRLLQGWFYFFHRNRPGSTPVKSPTISAVVRGTEYLVHVAGDGATRLFVLDGEVEASSAERITVSKGEQIVGRNAELVRETAPPIAELAQWILFYPAVLNLRDLDSLSAAWKPSAEAYQSGSARRAAELMPQTAPQNRAESLFKAALLLASGNVTEAREWLRPLASESAQEQSVRRGLEQLVASVLRQETVSSGTSAPVTSTEMLGEAYYQQSRGHLSRALELASKSAAADPEFAFARAKLAELQFAHGHLRRAAQEARLARKAAPELAQAWVIEGFFFAAQNRIHEAIQTFDHAIALEPAMGEAWLGKGLCLIRSGRIDEGTRDLQTAATLEPLRALHRTYLGKAFFHAGHMGEAWQDIRMAQELDAQEPTAWLYSSLLRERQNEFNQAIADLERSQELNDSRRLYRSNFLLDEDRAVRGANLARLYSKAGLESQAFREAVAATAADYGNFSAHLFLANSYNLLRDPRQTALRYETPWLQEFLLANLLSPVGGTPLSTHLSQHEYSTLFDRNHFGAASTTEYASAGDWLQAASQYARFGSTAYSFDAFYSSLNGQRPNHDFEQLTLSAQIKQQLSLKDTIYLQAISYDAEGGDLAARFDPFDVNRSLRFEESQKPLFLAGYHREWQPGIHTLMLAGFFEDTLEVASDSDRRVVFQRNNSGAISLTRIVPLRQRYESELRLFNVEAQQIWDAGTHTFTAGMRYQRGDLQIENTESATSQTGLPSFYFSNGFQNPSYDIERLSGYAYDYWKLLEQLTVIGGVDVSRLTFPLNHRHGPVAADRTAETEWSPKVGLVFTAWKGGTLRGSYSRSLGGVSLERSFSLESSQLAGFTQAFRSITPESVAGSINGEAQEVAGVAWDQKIGKKTYAGIAVERLRAEAARRLGAYELAATPPLIVSHLNQQLDFEERSASIDLSRLIGDSWTIGAAYRVSHAEFEAGITDAMAANARLNGFQPAQRIEALLHEVRLTGLFHHRSGFFSRAQLQFYAQDNDGHNPAIGDDQFWHLNFFVGYRFWQQRAEWQVGILNATDADYRIHPLNFFAEPYRNRTFTLSLKLLW
ncbi:MAG: FecR domain-containing protein [Verrucomicrobiota bacterium]